MPIALSSRIAAILLAVAAGPAAALGLGQIQVRSQPGQPLLAEIPIISTDPSELQGLQVQLASPETFSRIGLDPPQGIVSTLQFQPVLDSGGHPVIRVTSPAAVQQPLLTFLIEVDWGQGRLVREYSALLDTPRTVDAPLQPPIQAPVVAPSNTVVRPAPTPVVVTSPPSTPPSMPAPETRPAPTAAAIPPALPAPVPVAPPVEAAAMPAGTPTPQQYGPVKTGETLGQIATAIDPSQEHSAAQTMLALLRANPEAFIDGNVNLLKRGAILQVPDHSEFAHYNVSEAAALFHAQVVQWRGAPRTPLQSAAAPGSGTTTSTTTAAVIPAPARNVPAGSMPTRASVPRTREARLDIMPSSSRVRRAGAANQATQSGIQAGGEGNMLRQQLQETKETLAARDAEVNELRTRVADLEKLQQQQQQLLTLKNGALAAAQQTLAASNRKVEMPVAPQPAPARTTPSTPAVATTQAVPPATPAQPPASWGNAWLWGGLALVVLALAGWLMSRRRRAAEVEEPRRGFDTAALAASIPSTVHGLDEDEERQMGASRVGLPAEPPDDRTLKSPGPAAIAPTWHAPDTLARVPESSPGDRTPLQQAQSMLDVGDDESARAVLLEVLDSRDPAARETAARMLREL